VGRQRLRECLPAWFRCQPIVADNSPRIRPFRGLPARLHRVAFAFVTARDRAIVSPAIRGPPSEPTSPAQRPGRSRPRRRARPNARIPSSAKEPLYARTSDESSRGAGQCLEVVAGRVPEVHPASAVVGNWLRIGPMLKTAVDGVIKAAPRGIAGQQAHGSPGNWLREVEQRGEERGRVLFVVGEHDGVVGT